MCSQGMSCSSMPSEHGFPVWSADVEDLTRLLLAARDGDPPALAAAVRASQAEVWRLASHLVSVDDADDVTQDVYLRAWRALPNFRGESSGRTWLLAIARRACVDAVRARVRRRRLLARVVGEHASSDASELVQSLEPGRREAFVLTQIIGCSYEETGVICGVPIGTVRSRVARAREELLVAWRAAETG